MSEATEAPVSTPASRAKYKSAVGSGTPKWEIPNLELPKMEIPAAFREIAEKGVTQAKET